MKREFAATIFSLLLAGTAAAGPIESAELPAPAAAPEQATDSEQLRGLIDRTINEPAPEAVAPIEPQWATPFSAQLWLEGIPESDGVSLDVLASKQKRYLDLRTAGDAEKEVPTAYKWVKGNWRANISTNVTTATATSNPAIPRELNPDAYAAIGGSGHIDGRLEYDVNAWQFYGGTRRALIANPDGTLALNNNFTGGTFYKLPSSVFDGKIGTGFEVNPTGDAKAKVEYRHLFGAHTEAFLAAERSAPFQPAAPETGGTHGLKAGINRKF